MSTCFGPDSMLSVAHTLYHLSLTTSLQGSACSPHTVALENEVQKDVLAQPQSPACDKVLEPGLEPKLSGSKASALNF